MKKIVASLLFLGLGAVSASVATADAIPYPNKGTVAPEVPTFASTNGGVNIYFYGSTASYTDTIQVYDVQTKYMSDKVLNNHTTANGTEVTVGNVAGQINAGDQLVFYINSPDGLFANVASYSSDKVNHGYETMYTGGNFGIPAGLFVGLEDLNNGGDLNYNDDTFVFTGVSAPSITATPEPGSLALLGTGTLSLLGMARRRFLRA